MDKETAKQAISLIERIEYYKTSLDVIKADIEPFLNKNVTLKPIKLSDNSTDTFYLTSVLFTDDKWVANHIRAYVGKIYEDLIKNYEKMLEEL